MSPTTAIFRREFKSYFGTPLAYVFLALFLFAGAFWMYQDNFFMQGEASMRVFFEKLPIIFAVFAPLVAMRMWAEERRTGTIEMLLTLPVTTRQAVIGKFFAGWVFMMIALLLTLPIYLTVEWLGDVEFGPVFTGYVGAAFLGGAYLAISSFFSVLTKSQVISFVLALIACMLFYLVGNPAAIKMLGSVFGEGALDFFRTLSLGYHFDVMQRGLIELRNLMFFLIVSVGFVWASVYMLEDRKAA
jgi:ABC-2 type transport system permease protein